MTQAELDALKARLVLDIARRRDAEVDRYRRHVLEIHGLAHRAVLEAASEADAYEALSLYTQALALVRGIPLQVPA